MNKMWEPEFDNWSEGKVTMLPGELPTSSMSRGEYGVMMQLGMCDDSIPIDAAIFWTDEMHLYLRYDWETWYKVSTDDPDNCSNICKRNSAKLLLCTTTSIKHHAIKVYHIDSLPEELFGKQENKPSDGGQATQLDFDLPIPSTDCDEDGEADDEDGQTDADFLASTILLSDGSNVAHFEFEKYSIDFYELNGHLIAASYFDKHGDWMADEDSENGDTPVWFGAKEITKSPLAIAAKVRATVRPIIGEQAPFHSLILINKKCNIINENCHHPYWKNTDMQLVRKEKLADSMLNTVEETLKGFTGESRPEMAGYEPMILEALKAAFITNK